jgi:hypothetical protein
VKWWSEEPGQEKTYEPGGFLGGWDVLELSPGFVEK